MQRSLDVTTNVPITIQKWNDKEYRILLKGTTIATAIYDEQEKKFIGTVSHFPSSIRLSTSHDNLRVEADTMERCGADMMAKILNILINRYLFAKPKARDTKGIDVK